MTFNYLPLSNEFFFYGMNLTFFLNLWLTLSCDFDQGTFRIKHSKTKFGRKARVLWMGLGSDFKRI